MPQPSRVVVAVTGASGAVYATRLLRALLWGGHSVDLILSKYGRYLLAEEMGWQIDKETIAEFLQRLYGNEGSTGTLTELGLKPTTNDFEPITHSVTCKGSDASMHQQEIQNRHTRNKKNYSYK